MEITSKADMIKQQQIDIIRLIQALISNRPANVEAQLEKVRKALSSHQ
jgi:hypothetical protein